YGTSMGTLDKSATWAATDNINWNGLVLSGLTAGTQIFYQITSTLQTPGNMTLQDQSPVVSLTPISFSTISQVSDWAAWGPSGVMYELMVRTFADGGASKPPSDSGTQSGIDPSTNDGIGDLVGLRNMLPYLKDFGADAIWLMPVFTAKSYH